MFDFLFRPENIVFSTALVLMLLIGVAEAIGLGASTLESEPDLDAAHGSPMGWIGVGKVPLTVLLVTALGCFSLVGLALQQAATAWSGAPLGPLPAALIALFVILPLTAVLARLLARFAPHDETSAVSLDSLVGRRGRITLGTAAAGSPARARVPDSFGHSHYLLVEPHLDHVRLGEGDEILLVGRRAGLFQAIAVTPHPTLEQGDAT